MKSILSFCLLLSASMHAQVQVESIPESGIQPQVIVTSAGVVHLVFLKGDPKACDIRHTTLCVEGGEWTTPVTVNSKPRSAIAAGTIRGAQIALGKDGQIVTGLMDATTAQKIGPKNAKHPVLTQNTKGQTLITSVIGSGWSKAGILHWELLDSQGKSVDSGDGEKLPVWGYAAAYARPDGSFVILR